MFTVPALNTAFVVLIALVPVSVCVPPANCTVPLPVVVVNNPELVPPLPKLTVPLCTSTVPLLFMTTDTVVVPAPPVFTNVPALSKRAALPVLFSFTLPVLLFALSAPLKLVLSTALAIVARILFENKLLLFGLRLIPPALHVTVLAFTPSPICSVRPS